MRVIIAGTRSLADREYVARAMNRSGLIPSCVVSGGCYGVDASGEKWAGENGVPCVRYPADWSRYGRSAGPRRNAVMADNADALVAVWDGKSRGTRDMIDRAIAKGLAVHILCPWPWSLPDQYEAFTEPSGNT